MNLRKYGQPVKDQGGDVHDTLLCPALQGQTPSKPGTYLRFYLVPYLQPILLQLEAVPEPQSEDANGSVTPAEASSQGNATPPGTQPQTFALIKIDFGTCYFFVSPDRLLDCLYVWSARHKDCDIIRVRKNLRYDTASKKESTLGWICCLIPKPTVQWPKARTP